MARDGRRAGRGLAACAVLALAAAGIAWRDARGESGPTFEDVAPRSRIAYRSNNDFTGRKYFPQPMCGGVAVLDFDGDGRQDLFFTNGAKLPELRKTDPSFYSCLLRNRGDLTFEDVTARAGLEGRDLDFSFGVAAGDYDNDGRPDLFLCQAGRNALYRNNGDGTFTDVTAGSGLGAKKKDLLSVCAAFFDYDQDGLLDLVVSHYTHWSPQADIVCTMEGQGEIYCPPTKYGSVPHSLYRNLGGGRFEDVSGRSGFTAARNGKGMGIAVADFDDDGRMDVFVSNDTEPNFLYLNRGDGTFVQDAAAWNVDYNDQGNTVSGMGADAKDYDNDGRVDVFSNNLMTQGWGLFRNEGDRFGYASPASGVMSLSRRFSGWSNGFVDYDNDGWKDVYSANGDVDYRPENGPQRDTMFRNLGGRGFEDVAERLGPDFTPLGYQRGSAFADLNDDGFLDIVVTSLNRRPRILVNGGGNGNHWLMVETRGRRANRDGIGAKLKLTTAAGRVLHNHVTTSVGFMSSSDRRAHFGLGAEAKVRELEVRWPSGAVQRLTDVPVDRLLKVDEPG
ncbi:MAG TPA: CRTAC1 family protein [Vicinamibacteria bacterium]